MSSNSNNKKSSSSSLSKKGGMDFSKPHSKSSLANLTFPVSRVRKYMKDGGYATRISISASVYLSGVLEYLAVEILELSGNAAKDNKQQRIKPRYVQLAIRQDEEFALLLGTVTIRDGGVIPNIHEALRNTGKYGKKGSKSKGKITKSQLSESQSF